jgi:hypothetical protein
MGALLHPSVTERFTRCAPGLSGAARRTLRTNLRFIGRRVVPQFYPADLPLPRERAKAPYSPAQIAGFLALADAQPTRERRMRAAGLVCLGAGAGLIRGDLRDVRGSDVACRSGGVVVAVRGARARTVPVLDRYHPRLLAAAEFAGDRLICGGADPGRRNITNPLITALDGGRPAPAGHLPAARDLAAGCAQLLGLATFMHAAGISCSQQPKPDHLRSRQLAGIAAGSAPWLVPITAPVATTRLPISRVIVYWSAIRRPARLSRRAALEGYPGTRVPGRTGAQCGLAQRCRHDREAPGRTFRTSGSSPCSSRGHGPRG